MAQQSWFIWSLSTDMVLSENLSGKLKDPEWREGCKKILYTQIDIVENLLYLQRSFFRTVFNHLRIWKYKSCSLEQHTSPVEQKLSTQIDYEQTFRKSGKFLCENVKQSSYRISVGDEWFQNYVPGHGRILANFQLNLIWLSNISIGFDCHRGNFEV